MNPRPQIAGIAGTQGVGSLFMGLSMLATGWTVVRQNVLPTFLGWVGIVGGLATIFTLFAIATPFASLAGMAFFPALLLTIVSASGWEMHCAKCRENNDGRRRSD